MKKRCFATGIAIMLCITLLLPSVAFASGEEKTYEAEEYTLTYTTDESGNATITNFSLNAGITGPVDVDIPDKFTADGNEYTVTKIGDAAFSLKANSNRIKSVDFPDTVISIGENAFLREMSLESFSTDGEPGKLPSNLEKLGMSAFSICEKLAVNVVIPGTLKKISDSAFYNCLSLTGITISEGVEEIGSAAFNKAAQVKTLELPSTLKSLRMNAFNRLQRLEKLVFNGDNLQTVILASNDGEGIYGWNMERTSTSKDGGNIGGLVWTDAKSAGYTKFYFDNADTLKRVAGIFCGANGFKDEANKKYFVENNFVLSGFESGALDNDLYNAVAQTSFTYDGADDEGNAIISQRFSAVINGFKEGQSTENVDLTNVTDKAGNKYDITAIADNAFSGNTAIKTFTPGKALTSIGEKAFFECANLESAILNDGLTTLGYMAFSKSGIQSAYYPASITSKNEKVFENCKSLYDVCFADGVTYINNMLWGCDALTKLTIPAGVTTISSSNFNLTKLDSIYFLGDEFPDKVTDVALSNGPKKTFYVKNAAVQSAVEEKWGSLTKYGSAEIITEDTAIAGTYTLGEQLYGFICANGIKVDGSYIAVQYDTSGSISSVSAASVTDVSINANGQAVFKIDASFDKTKPVYLFILERDTIKPLCAKTEITLS